MPTEKTLELNITYEILQMCRQYDPNAFSVGTTLVQESNSGYDSRTLSRIPRSCITSPLQYKRAKNRIATGTNRFQYVFEINNNTYNDQHLILYHNLAGGRRRVAYYALPALLTDAEFISSIPQLLHRTFFVDVARIPPQFVGFQTHRITLDPQTRTAQLHSDESKLEVVSAEQYQGLIAEREIGLNVPEMLENMRQPAKEGYIPKSKRPRFLFNVYSPRKEKSQEYDYINGRIRGLFDSL